MDIFMNYYDIIFLIIMIAIIYWWSWADEGYYEAVLQHFITMNTIMMYMLLNAVSMPQEPS